MESKIGLQLRLFAFIYFVYFTAPVAVTAEVTREFKILEGLRAGTRIGFIGEEIPGSGSPSPPPPYLIVPVPGSSVDSDLTIEQNTGEIRTKISLDRETRDLYTLVAIPINGENIRVVIRVDDENDHAPTFAKKVMEIEFPENTPRDVKRTLLPARDRDLGIYNTQRYVISGGNVNNAFRLSSHRERDGVLYLDLQVNGFLDRETVPFYNLVIDAYDGGLPPLKGSMSVRIAISDSNDNSPVFNQSKYFATIAENATVGTRVLQVFATDTDAGNNGQITYAINRRQTDKESVFKINSSTGVISVNRPLDFESKELHELVVVARDQGVQPLETTVFVSIRVIDVKDNQLFISLVFLTEDALPKVSERAMPGEFVARVSVHDRDSKQEYSRANLNLTMSGGNGQFVLLTRSDMTYIVIADSKRPLDREQWQNYTLSISASDEGNPPLRTLAVFHLGITDFNDHAPKFEEAEYHASVLEIAEPGTSVLQVEAIDADLGNNSLVTYTLESTSDWFQIDRNTGLITTKSHIDCETEPMPRMRVIAKDHGSPALSSAVNVIVHVFDENDNEPMYEFSFYNVSVMENLQIGKCILNVSASDPDCGINAMVNYTIRDIGPLKNLPFKVNPTTGEICVSGILDFEERSVYDVPVIATDRGGLSSTTLVKIFVQDSNDNIPFFEVPRYNISLQEGSFPSGPIVSVAAVDKDSGEFGRLRYAFVTGNADGRFRIESSTGQIYLNQKTASAAVPALHHLVISATDGSGFVSEKNAEIWISVTGAKEQPPIFKQARYSFKIQENSPINSNVGTVSASLAGGRGVRYSISSGDPHSIFAIDTISGLIKNKGNLDHEQHAIVLLNIQAATENPPTYSHCQVEIQILDSNDNIPEFESSILTIRVPENAQVGSTIYGVTATDLDEGANGEVRYRLLSGSSTIFRLDPSGGQLILKEPLDFERVKRYTLIIGAADTGTPPKTTAANLTLYLEVQDVNDNKPQFTPQWSAARITVSESIPVNSHIAEVQALDEDTGNNGRITYSLVEPTNTELFGIFPSSGILYTKAGLDRETEAQHLIRIKGSDHGTPPLATTTTLTLEVTDENDCNPVFTEKSYRFIVEENNLPGMGIGRVIAKDADMGPNARIRYSIQPQPTHLQVASGAFLIESDTGMLIATTPLDREKIALYEFQVIATDHGVPSRQSEVIVEVRIADLNDNPPIAILPEENRLIVREEQPVGTEVTRIVAEDPDNGENGTIGFSFVHDNSGDADDFTIDANTGVLRTAVILDHEKKPLYTLGVRVRDKGFPALETILEYRVEVLDLSDNRPSFQRKKFNFKIDENATIGQIVGIVAGYDGENEVGITYILIRGNTHGSFDINKVTGAIFVSKPLDYETTSHYSLQVKTNGGDMNSETDSQSNFISIDISIGDINDDRPKFLENLIRFSVPENTAVGIPVWNFTAIDLDSGANGALHYHITQQVPANLFRINKLSGTLYIQSELDFEKQRVCLVVVMATDEAPNPNERLNSSVTAYIKIEDVNDNIPQVVSGSKVTIYGIEPPNAVIHTVIATDADSEANGNGKLKFSITEGNEGGNFVLDGESGKLRMVKSLILSSNGNGAGIGQTFVLNINVSDQGSKPNSVTHLLHVNVQDGGGSPPRFMERFYEGTVKENSLIGTEVIVVSAFEIGSVSGSSNNTLVYILPEGMVDGKFAIQPSTGSIYVDGLIDRETRSEYSFVVYVYDESLVSLMDTTRVSIKVKDLNDHAPDFRDSCEDLTVPENQELGLIHTFKIVDPDLGRNGEVTFNLLAGNGDNLFSVDMHSGKLTSRPLDREKQASHTLLVTAQDRGLPVQRTSCNITIFVRDENDSDPQFSKSVYSATIPENASIGTTILIVEALDADVGTNAVIKYSMTNESNYHFTIDNVTGAIMIAGHLDREKISEYSFEIAATDGGLYDSRFSKALVKIKVKDVNDQRPIWKKNSIQVQIPISTKPGQNIVQVFATDSDEGVNSEISYSLENSEGKFRIHPQSGIITPLSSLSTDGGRIFHLRVIARDKGIPTLSSSSLAVIQVGEIPFANTLRFQESFYKARVKENAISGTEVVQVTAVRNDGRRQRMIYTIIAGNEENSFEIGEMSGQIKVKYGSQLDREKEPEISLVITARTDSQAPFYSHVVVNVSLTDENDQVPIFNQNSYFAAVWEGNNKGTFVTQVTAIDADEGSNANLVYHIVDGNHDNAFIIEPAYSGIVKTNIVLDREVHDKYEITIIAMDEGSPQLTGTCLLQVNVIDINDTPPTFPPNSLINLNENISVGTVVTTVMANDVDTNPALIYAFAENGNPNDTFSIGKYSGRILLAKPVDFESENSQTIKIQVSDSVHTAFTMLTVNIVDSNDNWPEFEKNIYQLTIPDDTKPGSQVLKVTAKDKDSGRNAEVKYALQTPKSRKSKNSGTNLWIDEQTGTIFTNGSLMTRSDSPIIELTLVATDSGKPRRFTKATLWVEVRPSGSDLIRFSQDNYTVEISEDTRPGTLVKQLNVDYNAKFTKNIHFHYEIVSGNENEQFSMVSHNGDILLAKRLDREAQESYILRVSVNCVKLAAKCSAMTQVSIKVKDVRNTASSFAQKVYKISIGENKSIGSHLLRLELSESKTGGSDAIFDIISGNSPPVFELNSRSGVLSLARSLDYDSISSYRCVIRVQSYSSKSESLWNLVELVVEVEDSNDNSPIFPGGGSYLEFVAENEPIGTTVFVAQAVDMDKGVYGKLNYSIVAEGSASNKFHIDPISGVVTTDRVFDYESKNRYYFTLIATDAGGKFSAIGVQVDIDSRDEYAPQFTQKSFKFIVPSNAGPGHIIGRVEASDQDGGPDGRIIYQIFEHNSFFRVNRSTGDLSLKQKMTSDLNGSLVALVANSGRHGSKSAKTSAEILIGGPLDRLEMAYSSSMPDWVIVLLISTVLLIFVFCTVFVVLHMRQKKQSRNGKTGASSSSDNYNSAFDTLEYVQSTMQAGSSRPGSLYSPQYSDVADCGALGENEGRRANSTGSELSNPSSASSGRGSAEDGEEMEDEEIAMINDGSLAQQQQQQNSQTNREYSDMGMIHPQDDDVSSAKNAQEYFARLGIRPKIPDSHQNLHSAQWNGSPGSGIYNNGEVDGIDISNLIYAQIPEDMNDFSNDSTLRMGVCGANSTMVYQPSMNGSVSSIIHSEEESAAGYNWDYLLDWGPQYQPLAQVFAEIASLKDGRKSDKSGRNLPNSSNQSCSSGASGSVMSEKTVNTSNSSKHARLNVNVNNGSSSNRLLMQSARNHAPKVPSWPMLPRSPISHDNGLTCGPMAPSFSPALSPLANRSPSISPLVGVGPSIIRTSQFHNNYSSSDSDLKN